MTRRVRRVGDLMKYPREYHHTVGGGDVYRVLVPRWRMFVLTRSTRMSLRWKRIRSITQPCGCVAYRRSGKRWCHASDCHHFRDDLMAMLPPEARS